MVVQHDLKICHVPINIPKIFLVVNFLFYFFEGELAFKRSREEKRRQNTMKLQQHTDKNTKLIDCECSLLGTF